MSASQLTAAIPATDIAAAGTASVTVRNDPGGAVSNALTFTITQAPGGGAISREVWTGISGNVVSSIPLGAAPNITDTRPSFEAPTNWAENYGTRLHGYITAPATGSYTFWIASDDTSELWLSINNPSDDPVNKVNIASVSGHTNPREWTKYPSQKSVAIGLQAGQRYYVEALQKEGVGGDNLAVGWARPGQATSIPSEVIPGSVLSPFTGAPAGGLTTLSPSSTAAGGGGFTLTVTGSNFVSGGSVVRWNGADRTTTFVSASQLTAAIPATDIAAAGTASVTVRNDPGGAVSDALTFTITQAPGGGAISREVWTGISGNVVSSIPLGAAPNITDTRPSFEAPTNWAENYGTRLRGYITAPATGSYTFWIASDDTSELWLSINNPSDDPVNKVNIASVSGHTNPREWTKYPSQKSVAIGLQAGQRYYVEALQKEGVGGDNLAVGWARPGQATSIPSEVIPGSALSPFSGP